MKARRFLFVILAVAGVAAACDGTREPVAPEPVAAPAFSTDGGGVTTTDTDGITVQSDTTSSVGGGQLGSGG